MTQLPLENSAGVKMAIITPSYTPDKELCADLIASVQRFSQADVEHHIIVPSEDLHEFASLRGPRTHILNARSFLPRGMMRIPMVNGWINLRSPWPPIRGWIAQQLVKLSAAASMSAEVVLLTDSDIVFTRPFAGSTFTRDGKPEFFRLEDGVDHDLPRHMLWHAAARRLLGLAPNSATQLPDYISWPCVWSPAVVRDMLSHISKNTGLPWETAIGRELHFSEMILYGVYVDEILKKDGPVSATSTMRCINHSAELPLDVEALVGLLKTATPMDVAIMVSAKSGTPLDVRRSVLAGYTAIDKT